MTVAPGKPHGNAQRCPAAPTRDHTRVSWKQARGEHRVQQSILWLWIPALRLRLAGTTAIEYQTSRAEKPISPAHPS